MDFTLLGFVVLLVAIVTIYLATTGNTRRSVASRQPPTARATPSTKASYTSTTSSSGAKQRSNVSAPWRTEVQQRRVEAPLYQRLLARSHDKAQVERLIQYEAKRAPHASRAELMQNALDRWDRDNR